MLSKNIEDMFQFWFVNSVGRHEISFMSTHAHVRVHLVFIHTKKSKNPTIQVSPITEIPNCMKYKKIIYFTIAKKILENEI